MIRQPVNGKKICANHIPNERLTSRIYKELSKLNSEKQTTQFAHSGNNLPRKGKANQNYNEVSLHNYYNEQTFKNCGNNQILANTKRNWIFCTLLLEIYSHSGK